MLHRLEAHRISECPFARQDGLPLQVRVHHRDCRLVFGHLAHDAGKLSEADDLGGVLPAMPAHDDVSVARFPDGERNQDAVLLDALDELFHVLVVANAEGVIGERCDRGN